MATRNSRRDFQKEALWRGHIRAWEKSGLGVKDFCARKKLVLGTFQWWRQEIRRRNGEKKRGGRGRVQFAAVDLSGAGASSGEALGPGEMEVRLAGGARVRFRSDLGAEDLLRVLGALEGVRC